MEQEGQTEILGEGRYLSINEVCSLLGVGRVTAYSWLNSGELKSVKLTPKMRRVSEKALQDFIDSKPHN